MAEQNQQRPADGGQNRSPFRFMVDYQYGDALPTFSKPHFQWKLLTDYMGRRFVYRPWMQLARFLGTISSAVLLTLLFFLVVTPIGLLQRLFGKRPLDLRFKTNDASYWQKRTAPTPAHYEKQF